MGHYTNPSIDRLMLAISLVESPEECRALMDDLCTIKELQNMAMRLDTAILLSKGENYQEISRQAGVSTTTISRVSRNYYYGSDGYKKILERLEKAGKDSA